MASGDPDGLERVAADIGFLGTGLDSPFKLLPDYSIPFFGDTAISTILAGAVGVIILFGLLLLLGRSLRRKQNT